MVFKDYAGYYDMIYRNKGYARECAYLENLFKKYMRRQVKTILDLGCGTGNHMIPLIKKGYAVTGVDASAAMLKLASKKLKELGYKMDLYRGKLKSFRLDHKFDAVLCLFSVIDYVIRKNEIILTLKNIRRHMKQDALFIFDFWNESAVVEHYSPRKKNLYKENGSVLERRSTTNLYPKKRMCKVCYTCALKENGRLISRGHEKHVLRYFSIDEMKDYLGMAGLKVITAHPFLKIDSQVRRNTWDVTMVARKR